MVVCVTFRLITFVMKQTLFVNIELYTEGKVRYGSDDSGGLLVLIRLTRVVLLTPYFP